MFRSALQLRTTTNWPYSNRTGCWKNLEHIAVLSLQKFHSPLLQNFQENEFFLDAFVPAFNISLIFLVLHSIGILIINTSILRAAGYFCKCSMNIFIAHKWRTYLPAHINTFLFTLTFVFFSILYDVWILCQFFENVIYNRMSKRCNKCNIIGTFIVCYSILNIFRWNIFYLI